MSARDLLVIAAVTGGVIYAAIAYNALPPQPAAQPAVKPAALVNASTPSATETLKAPATPPNEAQRQRTAATESAPPEKRTRHRNREKTKHH